jgi:hypothetical protein
MAHVDLAKAEVSAIGGQIARTAALIGAAIALLIMVSILLVVGLSLFLGEWLLGSIGWGVLHGTLAFLSVALACVVAAVGVSAGRIGRAFLAALAIAVILAFLLSLALPTQVGIALGIAVGYIAWMVILGANVGRSGIDTEALKARFYPTQTIETSKETLEWLQKRMPPGIG